MAILDPSNPTPRISVSMNWASGSPTSGANDYSVILVGNKLSSGSALDSTIYGPQDFSDVAKAVQLFGDGSELASMVRKFLSSNKSSALYAIAVPEDGYQSSGHIVVSGSATSSTTLTIRIGESSLLLGVSSGDSATAIGDAIAALINSKTFLPVTASNTAGDVTLTSKQKGERTNKIKVSISSSSSFGSTISPLTPTAMSGGSGVDDITDATSVIDGNWFYSIVCSMEDDTNLGELKDFLREQEDPNVGRRMRGFAGCTSSLGTAITSATSLNYERMCLVYQYNCEVQAHDLAVAVAAKISNGESKATPQLNFNGEIVDLKFPVSKSKASDAQIRSMIVAGLTPVDVDLTTKTSAIVKACTTRSLTNGQAETRIKDLHKVFVCDRYANDLVALLNAKFHGKNISQDLPESADVRPNLVTPKHIKSTVKGLVDSYAVEGLLEEEEKSKDELTVVLPVGTNVFEINLNLDPVNILDSIGVQINQVG